MSRFDTVIDRKGTSAIKLDACKHIFGSENVIPMWVADMDLATAPEITEALVKRAQHGIYGYTGDTDEDYNAIIDWEKARFGADVKREWIMWNTGVVDGIYVSLNALTRAGDKVLIQTPVYTPFFKAVQNTGRILRPSPLKNDNGYFTMDFEDIENAFRGGVQAMILCSPHNPVGRVWTRDEVSRVVELCRKYDVLLIADEIHDGFIFKGHTHESVLTFDYDNTVMLMSSTKAFNLAGLDICNMIVKRADYRERIQHHMTAAGAANGTNNVFGYTAQRTAYSKCGYWLDELTEYIEGNVDVTMARLAEKMPLIKCHKPEGTYLMWLNTSALGTSDEVFKALCEAGVGLNNGKDYGSGDQCNGYMRFNVACPRSQVEAALDCMEKAYAVLTTK